jgi:hypothetical protein
MDYLVGQGEAVSSARLGMRIARALALPAAAIDDATRVGLSQVPQAEAETFAKELLSRDDSVEAHRVYQEVLIEANQRDRAIKEYAARLASHPGSPDAEYLAMRVLPYEEERKMIDGVVDRYPDHPFLLRAGVFVHYSEGDFGKVALMSERFRAVNRVEWQKIMEIEVDALVGLGRGSEALDLLRSIDEDASTPVAFKHRAELLAFRVAHRLARSAGEEPTMPDYGTEGWVPAFARATAGVALTNHEIERLKDGDMKSSMAIAMDARTDPAAALAKVRKATAGSIALLPASVTVLLLAEAARVSDAGVVEKLRGPFGGRAADAMVGYVKTGTFDDSIRDYPLELQAALHLVRSRVGELSAKEKAACIARAKDADLLKGPVTVAMEGWTS